VLKEIRQLERQLNMIRLAKWSPDVLDKAKKLERRLCELFEREEVMVRQRSWADWLKEGDHNTAFFHACTSAHHRTNKIRALIHEDGSRCEEIQEIKAMTETFYGHFFLQIPVPLMKCWK
jgi:hypothetical protein